MFSHRVNLCVFASCNLIRSLALPILSTMSSNMKQSFKNEGFLSDLFSFFIRLCSPGWKNKGMYLHDFHAIVTSCHRVRSHFFSFSLLETSPMNVFWCRDCADNIFLLCLIFVCFWLKRRVFKQSHGDMFSSSRETLSDAQKMNFN